MLHINCSGDFRDLEINLADKRNDILKTSIELQVVCEVA
jgi:hypothetical protein